jgi:uncharacterized protein (DUF1800 family)
MFQRDLMFMTPAAIAANRFGLGMRPDTPVSGDPKMTLLKQLERFDPRPAALATVPSRGDIAGTIQHFFEEKKADKQERTQAAKTMTPDALDLSPNRTKPLAPSLAGLKNPRSPEFVQARDDVRELYINNVAARFTAALTTPAPFVERLVHFWANHFAVSVDKPPVVAFAGSLEFHAIRPNVMGRFVDMLRAVEQHPAMLIYLDQTQSIGPNSMMGTRRAAKGNTKAGLNENLAREILELHTLGVRSGYTQADVTEFARAMTGWEVAGLNPNGPLARLGSPGETVFVALLHEPGTRSILGRNYRQEGAQQSLSVLDDLAGHPATAQHIATKLARHFAGDTPPRALVSRLANTFQSTGGDLPSLYRVLIEAPECWAPQPTKFKTPWDWSVSALRALNLNSVDPKPMTNMMVALGQQVWKPGSPAGYDDIDASWAAPDALVRRVEIAQRFAQRAGGAVDARALAQAVLPGSVSASTQAALGNAESGPQALAMLFASPEFLRR